VRVRVWKRAQLYEEKLLGVVEWFSVQYPVPSIDLEELMI